MQASSTEGMVLNISQNANKSKEQRKITQLVEPAQKAFCFFFGKCNDKRNRNRKSKSKPKRGIKKTRLNNNKNHSGNYIC